jgi:hypothetical protein
VPSSNTNVKREELFSFYEVLSSDKDIKISQISKSIKNKFHHQILVSRKKVVLLKNILIINSIFIYFINERNFK